MSVLGHPKAMVLEVYAVWLSVVLQDLLSPTKTPTRPRLSGVGLVVVIAPIRVRVRVRGVGLVVVIATARGGQETRQQLKSHAQTR